MSVPGAIIPGLERITGLLSVMGHPEAGLKYIHIAGTNGKGSTGLIIAGILQESGCRVGIYSSPHLHSYTERYRINGREIEPVVLKTYVEGMPRFIAEMEKQGYDPPTEFEILTAIGFQYFHDEHPDYVILEVGMGGIYDTTNVIDPLISVITGIDYDHTAYLGETLAEIAANKAGIIKPGRPVVVGPVAPEAYKVISERAATVGADLYSSDLASVKDRGGPGLNGQIVDILYNGGEITEVLFSLAGLHQRSNLATALTTLLVLGNQNSVRREHQSAGTPDWNETFIRRALGGLKHPGRLEVVCERPLVIVDAAHNPQGTRALAESLFEIMPERQRVLVCGWLNDKDVEHSLEPLGPETRLCIVTRPESARGSEWQRVAEVWQNIYPHKSCLMEESIQRAVDIGISRLQEDEYLLVTGSFYVLDQARSYLLDNQRQVKYKLTN